jgi:hypothetical protein
MDKLSTDLPNSNHENNFIGTMNQGRETFEVNIIE